MSDGPRTRPADENREATLEFHISINEWREIAAHMATKVPDRQVFKELGG